ncbi:N-acyl homoserine lactonase family protein [Variovorax sp. N23]|uniref:N-acyl homoserine lactonase family protein n=1 Tax=Variovorax sp. N23 TaxID=2980555 RepID=UPI0021C91235|nr:N-acyl homoserine lactonase family protein [Variovorax sp. N23]MCU4119094.1 N-acyl homoserine lactonase family protein [Variovorax sp. N23]
MKHAAEVLAISILGTLFAWGAPASSWAQQIGGGSIPPVSIKLYTLDCGLTEFQGAGSDVFSDTGEYEGKSLELPTPCFLIQHGKDWLLWDTGLSDKLAVLPNGQEKFGGRFSVRRTLAAQLKELSLKPDDIRYVGISHLHFDHTGNIGLFPRSTFIVAASELASARGKPKPFGVDTASIRPLSGSKILASDMDHDVFGDGTVKMLKTPGHTHGHRSLIVKLPQAGVVLITGDLYHTRLNYEKGLIPRINDRAETMASIDRFARIRTITDARVVIQHSPEDFASMPAFPRFLE